jgi:hypothetical protein
MKVSPVFAALLSLAFFSSTGIVRADNKSPLSNEVVLIVRHAEKQPDGPGLTPAGVQRAALYVHYFENFQVDSKVRPPDVLYASADSKKTARCRLTIPSLSQDLKLPINTSYKNDDYTDLAQAIEQNPGGKTVLICWHHENIGNIIAAFGANPLDLIPNNTWPEDRYNWVIELRYDNAGHLIPSEDKLIVEHLLPGDTK